MQTNLTLTSLDAVHIDVTPPQGTPETLRSALATLTKNKHAIIVSGDLGAFPDPSLAHTAAVASFHKLRAATLHLDPVIVIEGRTAGADRIFGLAETLGVPVVRIEPSTPDTGPRSGETIVCSGNFDDGDSHNDRSLTELRAALYSGIQNGAAAKSLLIFGNSEQIWATSFSATGEGFNIVGLRNNHPALGPQQAETFRHAEISLRRNSVPCHDIYDSPFANEVEKHVRGKTVIALVTSGVSDYVDRPAVKEAMLEVLRKFGATADDSAGKFVVMAHESGADDRLGDALDVACENGIDSLFVYSDEDLYVPPLEGPAHRKVLTSEFPRNGEVESLATVCSEVLGVASQVNAGATQVMVIFGSAFDSDDALTAARRGERVIVLEDHLPKPEPKRAAMNKASMEYEHFHRAREPLEAAGVKFYKNVEAMPDDSYAANTRADTLHARLRRPR